MTTKHGTQTLGSAVAAALLLALASAPARAETPSYVGTWASDIAQCKVEQDRPEAPLVMQEKRYDQHETHCTFKSISGENGEWDVKAGCKVEGSDEPYDFTLTVSGDTLTVTDETGARDLLRCR